MAYKQHAHKKQIHDRCKKSLLSELIKETHVHIFSNIMCLPLDVKAFLHLHYPSPKNL